MDGYKVILDLDKRVCVCGIRGVLGGSLGEWMRSDPYPILNALRIPNTNRNIDSLLTEGRQAYVAQTSPLLRLPPELVDAIFTHIIETSGEYDMRLMLFALTCKTLLECARRHIVRDQTRRRAPLARHRLICVEDEDEDQTLRPTDYPHGMLTSSEVETLLNARHDTGGERTAPSSVDREPVSLFNHATGHWGRYVPPPRSTTPPKATGKGLGLGMAGIADLLYRPSAVSRMSRGDFERFQVLTTLSCPDGAAVLCNLSKGEYVRAIEEDGIGAVAEDHDRITLWHMLLACICWRPRESEWVHTAAGDVGKLGHGRWAGDRFVVTTEDNIDSLEMGRRWKDITSDVLQLVEELPVAYP